MKAAIHSPAYCRLTVGVLAQADAAPSVRAPQPELGDRQRGDRGLLLGGADLVAAAHGVVQRIVGLVRVQNARDAEVRREVARVQHYAGDRLLTGCRNQLGREPRQLLEPPHRTASAWAETWNWWNAIPRAPFEG